jgi:hypothetical protein
MSSSSDKKKSIKEIKETKAPKTIKITKEHKASKVSKNITLDTILEDNNNNNNNIIDNSKFISENHVSEDIETILQEINDAELAMAMDESFASNIALQINSSHTIDSSHTINNTELIKQLIEKDIMLQEDEKYARSLSVMHELDNSENRNSRNTENIELDNSEEYDEVTNFVTNEEDDEEDDEVTNEVTNEEPNEEYDEVTNEVTNEEHNDDELKDILEQIRKFEESEKYKIEREIRVQQDLEYENVLREDMRREMLSLQKTSIATNENIILNKDKRVQDVKKLQDVKRVQEDTEDNVKETSLTKEEMRSIRLAYYNKK